MSTSRNHSQKSRTRDFARRTGFTYQQAQQYLRHFDALDPGEPDLEGDRVMVVLASEIRVGDYLFVQRSVNFDDAWATDISLHVTAVGTTDDVLGRDFVTVTTGSEYTTITTAAEFRPHQHVLVNRSPIAPGQQFTDWFVYVDAPELFNAHMAIEASDKEALSAIIGDVTRLRHEYRAAGKPEAATQDGQHIATRWVIMPETLLTSSDSEAPPWPEDARSAPSVAEALEAVQVSNDYTLAHEGSLDPFADTVTLWVPHNALVVDATGRIGLLLNAPTSMDRSADYPVHVDTSCDVADDLQVPVDITIPDTSGPWPQEPFTFVTPPSSVPGYAYLSRRGDPVLAVTMLQDQTGTNLSAGKP